jgi:PhzF family phenazine biosynthesis protein
MTVRFAQVDVFGSEPYLGNPVAVVLDGSGLSRDEMQLVARWTNLSETTFVLPPTQAGADYRVRIFTPGGELPFAGHPTLGTAHAWLSTRDSDLVRDHLVQECDAGLIRLRSGDGRWFFSAPPLVRYEPVDDAAVLRLAGVAGVDPARVKGAQWVDNGPGWVALLLDSAETVLGLRPGHEEGLSLGVVGPYPDGAEISFEVRAFFSSGGVSFEDPVTGSLNASLAHWHYESGRVDGPYVASQGTVIGRQGRVYVERDQEGTIWVGGNTFTCVGGTIAL